MSSFLVLFSNLETNYQYSNKSKYFYCNMYEGIKRCQGSTLRKNFISPAGLVTETFSSPEIFLLALIFMTTLVK